jgi:glucuronate isomerase
MDSFIKDDFLLDNNIAYNLYHDFAKDLPIIDYHCHIDPSCIAKDKHYDNITQLWLYGDHYKWRLMRANGISEKYITGNAPDNEKFQKWGETMETLIGNPLFHWSHLELKRYFDCDMILTSDTANSVWELCNKKVSTMSAKELIRRSNVELICTTDDPASNLEYHKQISDSNFESTVLPTWRPDGILHIESDGFCEYISKLSKISGIDIIDLDSFKKLIISRMDYFSKAGCKLSDHSLSYIEYAPVSDDILNHILTARLSGKSITSMQAKQYAYSLLVFMAKEYARRNWCMQLHLGVIRNNNSKMYKVLGADTGFDAIGDNISIRHLGLFLDNLTELNSLPKTIIYSLNPNDNLAIDTMIGCFQDDSVRCKIQHGAAWWFNDNKQGILNHLSSLASQGCLGNFVGMLTDSRSLLSYTRHEYFRRILCSFVGNLVAKGEFPNDRTLLKNIIQNICYYNAKKYFNF